MGPEAIFPIMILVLLAYFVTATASAPRIDAEWERAAKQLGLDFKSGASYTERCISGRLGGFDIVITSGRDSRVSPARLIIEGRDRMDWQMLLHGEGLWIGIKKQLAGEDLLIGDEAFDSRVHIQGPAPQVRAVLNAEARKLIVDFIHREKGRVAGGRVEVAFNIDSSHERIASLAHAAVNVIAKLVLPEDRTAQALAENALVDPVPEVRTRNLACLVALLGQPAKGALLAVASEAQPLDEGVAACAQAALSDADPQQRLLGALLLEAEPGFVALQALAEQESVPVSVRAAAITILTARYPWHRVQPTIISGLAANSEQLVTMAVFAVGAARAVALFDQVCKLAADAKDDLAVEIAKTLQQLGSADAEPALIKLLSRTSDEVRVWTAEALKRVGTVRSVEPLLLAASGNASIDLKNTARSAVRAIQNRLGDVEAGGLSLVDSAAGESAGALSLATEDGGLSLSVREPTHGALPSAARRIEQAKA